MRIYGPVPSRRFGLSLGIDLLPRKTCSFDCIYCQVGPTDRLTTRLEDFFSVDDILEDVEEALEEEPTPDVLTFAGSGEPTLYKSLGTLLDGLHELTGIPILLITNGSLLWREEVARAVMKADILAPSLDAGDEAVFRRLNGPHPDISYERLLEGLRKVTHAFSGKVHLEVMLVHGVNDDDESLSRIAERLRELRCDRIDINTPVRPPVPERSALPCDEETLERAMRRFGPLARPIGTFDKPGRRIKSRGGGFTDLDKDIREMIMRRPCTSRDIELSLGIGADVVSASIKRLVDAGLVDATSGNGERYYRARPRTTIIQT